MEAARSEVPLAAEQARGRSRHLLRLASDERLVKRVREGSEQAFTVLYERYHRQILSFCRHMLGSPDEAEDAVQQTFINAYRDMLHGEKELHFRAWLYRIARNHCISLLRGRRPQTALSETEPSLVGLSEEVAGRSELRDFLEDLSALPDDQREALVLAELHDNSHTEVAEIVGCGREKVKSLVFQARSSLIKSREAREVPCEEIRRQLSVLRGGALRRNVIRRHLKDCEGCRAFSHDVKRQRQALAIVLPVIPTAALKFGAASAIAAVGAKAGVAGAAAGGAAAAGASAGAAGGASAVGAAAGGAATGGGVSGSLAALGAKLGIPAVVMKGAAATATVAVVAGGGTAGVKVARDVVRNDKPVSVQDQGRPANGTVEGKKPEGHGAAGLPARERSGGRKGERRRREKKELAATPRNRRRAARERRRAQRRGRRDRGGHKLRERNGREPGTGRRHRGERRTPRGRARRPRARAPREDRIPKRRHRGRQQRPKAPPPDKPAPSSPDEPGAPARPPADSGVQLPLRQG